jgi:cell division protease FtsH
MTMDARRARFSIGYFLLAFLALLAIQWWLVAGRIATLPYSEFKALVARGAVADLELREDRIAGTLKEPRGAADRFVTVRVADPALVSELEAAKIAFAGRTERRWCSSDCGASR